MFWKCVLILYWSSNEKYLSWMKETERVPKKAARQKYKSRDSLWVENSFNWNYSFITEKKRSFTKVCAIMPKGLKGNTNKHWYIIQANQACLWQYTEVLLESMTTCETWKTWFVFQIKARCSSEKRKKRKAIGPEFLVSFKQVQSCLLESFCLTSCDLHSQY